VEAVVVAPRVTHARKDTLVADTGRLCDGRRKSEDSQHHVEEPTTCNPSAAALKKTVENSFLKLAIQVRSPVFAACRVPQTL
jgi:hypothetical protein